MTREEEWGIIRRYHRDDNKFEGTVPTIEGNPSSETIEKVLRKIDVLYRRVCASCFSHDSATRIYATKRARIHLLESCRHFLIAIQHLLIYFHMRQRLQETGDARANQDHIQKQ